MNSFAGRGLDAPFVQVDERYPIGRVHVDSTNPEAVVYGIVVFGSARVRTSPAPCPP